MCDIGKSCPSTSCSNTTSSSSENQMIPSELSMHEDIEENRDTENYCERPLSVSNCCSTVRCQLQQSQSKLPPKTRNAFLNYFNELLNCNTGERIINLVKRAANNWRSFGDSEKCIYIQDACKLPYKYSSRCKRLNRWLKLYRETTGSSDLSGDKILKLHKTLKIWKNQVSRTIDYV